MLKGMLLSAVLVLSGFLLGQAALQRRTLEANVLLIKDEFGRVRIRLAPDSGFSILDENGKERINLLHGDTGERPGAGITKLSLCDHTGKDRASIGLVIGRRVERSWVEVKGEDLKTGVIMDSGGATDETKVAVSGPDGNSRAVLGNAGVVNKKTGTESKRSLSSLVLFGPDGSVLESLP